MTVTFNNGTALEVIAVNAQHKYFQGIERDSFEYVISKSTVSFDILDSLFSNESATCKVTLRNDSGSYVYDDYSLRESMKLETAIITPATPTEAAETEERYFIIMAQKTYTEKQLDSLRDTVDTLVINNLGG